ncbi:phosphate signaling complex protein PhoU [Calorimonas adulescens]|jgi:phosphate transport system regulatory protein PhoU|uniref:Phosphate-specific transport system accessory protein PhoU n=1 Tax=Calorimonas adulescens TaxID=2606906 RepID=A0A5D8QCX6_9THEO|nr:phosphate signaling complex protein PhoU [Calorimonas adulescens]TZE81969.1 phosphate signaling complex protein PhoU [Calorimonas adulescens]
MTTRYHYDEQLEDLHLKILKLGSMVEEAIDKSIRSLVEHDKALAEEVIDNDDVIDSFTLEIDDECVRIIATQQPLARDLRIIVAGLKLATDLERIADHAVDIAKITERIADEVYIKPLIDIPRMAEMVKEMVKGALDAYVTTDSTRAIEITKLDDEVDGIYKQMFRELLTYMMEDQKNIHQATQFLFVGKSLERIADHATNICEWVIYIDKGIHEDLNK